MKSVLILVLLQFLYLHGSTAETCKRLKVSIYYESQCSYSAEFITKEFYPAYQKIKSSLQVDFVPYGNTRHEKINGRWIFDCQHGEDECWGNKAQACGLAANRGQDENVEYIYCIMKHKDPVSDEAVHQCAPKLGVSSMSILECAGSIKGDELHAKFGEQTKAIDQIRDLGVPLIIFNDKFDENLDAKFEFLRVSCSQLPNHTEGCPSEDNKLTEE